MPRSEKRTIASGVDLFLIECLSKFELISLPAPMIEHIKKVIYEKEGKHGMSYGYFLKKVFDHYGIIKKKESPGTIKQKFSLTTSVENECIEGVSKLLVAQESLNKEMDELRIMLAAKDTEIVHLKLQHQKLSSEGPGSTKLRATKNKKLKAQIVDLTGRYKD